jgi:hypothetical protein
MAVWVVREGRGQERMMWDKRVVSKPWGPGQHQPNRHSSTPTTCGLFLCTGARDVQQAIALSLLLLPRQTWHKLSSSGPAG